MSTARIEIDEPIQGARPTIGARVALTGRVTQTRGEGVDEQVEIQIEQMAFEPAQTMVNDVRAQQALRRGPLMGGPGGGPPPGAPPSGLGGP
jgi:hypothetical protein